MKRRLWQPAPVYCGGEKHCGNCALSIAYYRTKANAKRIKCKAKIIKIKNDPDHVIVKSTCTGQENKYLQAIIKLK